MSRAAFGMSKETCITYKNNQIWWRIGGVYCRHISISTNHIKIRINTDLNTSTQDLRSISRYEPTQISTHQHRICYIIFTACSNTSLTPIIFVLLTAFALLYNRLHFKTQSAQKPEPPQVYFLRPESDARFDYDLTCILSINSSICIVQTS